MYRRLIAFGVAVAAVALLALVIPLALSARDVVQIQELGEAAARARSAAAQWEELVRTEGPGAVPTPGQGETYLDRGRMVGQPPAPQAADVVGAAASGQTATAAVDGWGYAASPAFLGTGPPAVVLVTQTPQQMTEDLWPRLAAIAAVSLALLGLAALAAWRLAAQTAAPLTALAATAHRVADGDLTARAQPTDLAEVDQVGVALNRVTERVQELLAEQRSSTAELAHQLRTPLTVLSVDIDAVADPVVRERLRDDLEQVQRQTDEIIEVSRRPEREGLHARCDACAVIAQRVQFWAVLAEDQGRPLTVDIPDGPLPVRLTEQDLATAVDILLQNVFVHTPEGTAFGISVLARPDGSVAVEVADEGPGFAGSVAGGPGSTGLGLSIAARVAQASGGALRTSAAGIHGASAVLLLGPAAP